MTKTKLFFSLLFSLSLSTTYAMPNPAATNCADKGLSYLMISNTGFCVLRNRTYCEEWAFYRGTCAMGMNRFPGGKYQPRRQNQYCVMQNKRNPRIVYCLR